MLDCDWSLDVPLGNFLQLGHIRLVDRASINPKPRELHCFSVPSTQSGWKLLMHWCNFCTAGSTVIFEPRKHLHSPLWPLSHLLCWTRPLCLSLVAPPRVFGEFLPPKLCTSETCWRVIMLKWSAVSEKTSVKAHGFYLQTVWPFDFS